MKKTISILFALAFVLPLACLSAVSVSAQSGGTFAITESVIAAGGGQQTMGGTFSLDGTIGQSLAGANSTSGNFSVRGGFWTTQFAPTAAGASLSGRVKVDGASGKGIRNITLTLINTATGEIRTVRSGIFGAYRFEELSVGQSYFLTVSARRFTFVPDTRFITLLEELTDVDFVGMQQF